MHQERLSTGEFTIFEAGAAAGRFRVDHRRRQREKRMEEKKGRAVGMWLKIAICAVALLIVIAIEVLALTGPENEPVRAVSGEAESGGEDAYGKLRFVSGQGARSVFSISQRWSAPLDALEVSSIDDGGALFTAEPGARISLPAAGEVRELFTHAEYGPSVRIYHGEGLESVYYGFDEIRVEEGQPLLALDTLGTLGESGSLLIHVRQSDRLEDALRYIDAVRTR